MATAKTEIGELVSISRELLRQCEAKIEGALDDAWHALQRIHDEKLYKADKFATFELYAEQRWGYSKSRAYQLIDHAKLLDHMKAEGITFLPSGEGLTRPLQKLKRTAKTEEGFLKKATEAWQIATDMAPKQFDVPQVTGQHVEETIKHFGLYRNPKKSSDSAMVDELKGVLSRLTHCDALKKMSGYDFVERHGSRAFPSEFHEVVNWLTECAEVAQLGGK
jgi:hypothetical protein